jgi:hypothetical protein
MDLSEFVRETLVSIKTGVASANSSVNADKNAPTFKMPGNEVGGTIDFDVAVVAGEESTSGKHGGIKVAWLGAGGEKSSAIAKESTSRVKFIVWLADDIK